jgi:hypothetical protein
MFQTTMQAWRIKFRESLPELLSLREPDELTHVNPSFASILLTTYMRYHLGNGGPLTTSHRCQLDQVFALGALPVIGGNDPCYKAFFWMTKILTGAGPTSGNHRVEVMHIPEDVNALHLLYEAIEWVVRTGQHLHKLSHWSSDTHVLFPVTKS